MKEWWNWSPQQGTPQLGFAVVGVGRFGSAVCRELMQNGADVLAVDRSERSIEELRQLEPSIEARVVDCTDEESMREAHQRTNRSKHHNHADRQGQRGQQSATGDCPSHQ